MIQLSRKIFFCCSLANKGSYTGLNLVLEVFFQGKVDKTSNLVINFFHIESFLKKSISHWDHKEFVDTSFSDLAKLCALHLNEQWPFPLVKLTKISLSVTEPFKEVEVSF